MERVLIGLLFLLLFDNFASVAHASKTPPRGVIEAGRDVAAVSGLRDAGCPLDGSTSIPSYFHRERSGASYVAETAVVLPMTLERTVQTLRAVEEYPRWAFVDPNGVPNLKDLAFDPQTGRGEVRIANSEDATLHGRITLHRDGEGSGVRLELLESDRIENVILETVALPAKACPDATIVTIRLSWEIGFFGRMAARDLTWIPALFVVALRDDLVAHALASERRWAMLLGDLAEPVEGGWRYTKEIPPLDGLDPNAEWRIQHIKPSGVTIPGEQLARMAPWIRRMRPDKPPKVSVGFGAFFGGLEGPHTISGYNATATAADRKLGFPIGEPPNMQYNVFLSITDEGGSLGMFVDFPERKTDSNDGSGH